MRFRNGHEPKPEPQEEVEVSLVVEHGDAVYIKLKNSAVEAVVLKINSDGTYSRMFITDMQAAKLGLRRDSGGRLIRDAADLWGRPLMANY